VLVPVEVAEPDGLAVTADNNTVGGEEPVGVWVAVDVELDVLLRVRVPVAVAVCDDELVLVLVVERD